MCRCRLAYLRVTTLLAATALPSGAQAEQPLPQVRFSADRASFDLDSHQASLDGRVRASCGRFRLRADHLTIEPHDGEVDVTGPAEVLLCPCDDAPVTVAFDSARIAPPSDIVLTRPAARVGGVTVLRLPALWLRTADRPGLLVPRVAWRGRDGLLLGPGFHVPFRSTSRGVSALQLYVSGYSSGGYELEPSLSTPDSFTRARFDKASGTLATVESRGAAAIDSPAGLTWLVDLARGDRARSGWISAVRAAVPFDQARAFVSARPAGALIATGVDSASARAADTRVLLGPVAMADFGGAAAPVAWRFSSSARSLSDSRSTFDVLRAQGRADVGALAGPVALAASAHAHSFAVVGAEEVSSDVGVGSSARVSLPLARRFGNAGAGWLHVIEPYAEARAVGSRSSGDVSPVVLLAPGSRWVGSFGVRTSAGQPRRDDGLALELGGGWLGAWSATGARPAAHARAEVLAGVVGVAAESAAARSGDGWGAVLLSFARVGSPGRSQLRGSFAAQTTVDPADARVLLADDVWGQRAWMSASGSSLAPGATVVIYRGVRAYADGWWGLAETRFLGAQGGVGYGHPCGCVDASINVAHRLGREGTDAWLALSLAP